MHLTLCVRMFKKKDLKLLEYSSGKYKLSLVLCEIEAVNLLNDNDDILQDILQ